MFNTVDALRAGSEIVKTYAQECIIGVSNGLPAYRSNVIVGFRNIAPGRANVLLGNNNVLKGDSNIVIGSNFSVTGSNNIIIGGFSDNNTISLVSADNQLILGGITISQAIFGSISSIARPQPTTSSIADINSNVILGPSAVVSNTATIITSLSNIMVGTNGNFSSAVTNVDVGYTNHFSSCSSNIVLGGSNVVTGLSVGNICIGSNTTLSNCSNMLFINNQTSATSYSNLSGQIILGDSVVTLSGTSCTMKNLSVVSDITCTGSLILSNTLIINNTSNANTWSMTSTGSELAFTHSSTNAGVDAMIKFNSIFDTTQISFTGTHRCLFNKKNGPPFTGALLCVTGEVVNLDGKGIGNSMEAIPEVMLATTASDVRVIGVYAKTEDVTGWRDFKYGNVVIQQKRVGPPRVLVNSTGEGAVYALGPVDVGDLLTTSILPGVAVRQLTNDGAIDRYLYAYTIAKATTSLKCGHRGMVGCMYLM